MQFICLFTDPYSTLHINKYEVCTHNMVSFLSFAKPSKCKNTLLSSDYKILGKTIYWFHSNFIWNLEKLMSIHQMGIKQSGITFILYYCKFYFLWILLKYFHLQSWNTHKYKCMCIVLCNIKYTHTHTHIYKTLRR